VDFEKEKLFEEKYPLLYSLLSAIALGVEEGKTEWDVVREEVRECETAKELIKEIEEFLKDKPAEFEHVVEDVANNYFDDTNGFLRWIEQIKRYVTSVKGRLCG
jgi:chemotaxis regulatin CheY-phosphate phosphatase CheZ